MIGMTYANKTIKRFKHLYDRFSEILHFTPFSLAEINKLITELSEVNFSSEAIASINSSKFVVYMFLTLLLIIKCARYRCPRIGTIFATLY